MAPPLPPPGVPDAAGFAPLPIALLPVITLLSTVQETPMLLSAPPLEHCPPRNVSLVMNTGLLRHWASARIAAPPRSGPPPPPPKSVLLCRTCEFPFSKVMFCTMRCGHCWLKQSEVVIRCFLSHVS